MRGCKKEIDGIKSLDVDRLIQLINSGMDKDEKDYEDYYNNAQKILIQFSDINTASDKAIENIIEEVTESFKKSDDNKNKYISGKITESVNNISNAHELIHDIASSNERIVNKLDLSVSNYTYKDTPGYHIGGYLLKSLKTNIKILRIPTETGYRICSKLLKLMNLNHAAFRKLSDISWENMKRRDQEDMDKFGF
jgi:uncharacterized phage infection (PIP) family protein YhgE